MSNFFHASLWCYLALLLSFAKRTPGMDATANAGVGVFLRGGNGKEGVMEKSKVPRREVRRRKTQVEVPEELREVINLCVKECMTAVHRTRYDDKGEAGEYCRGVCLLSEYVDGYEPVF